MQLETGDIGINAADWPGHVMMCYSGGSDTSDQTIIIHANASKNFHKAPQQYSVNNALGYLLDSSSTWIFRPPWEKIGNQQAHRKKEELKAIADAISRSSMYGKYRAVRLQLGDSSFGGDARARLAKYRLRKAQFLAGASAKFVSTVTCAEAVILSYQLTFGELDAPFFIHKDAAHTMPRTLKDWLKSNWKTISAGKG